MPVAITGGSPQPSAAIAGLAPLHAPLHGEDRVPHQLVSPDLPTSLTSLVPDFFLLPHLA